MVGEVLQMLLYKSALGNALIEHKGMLYIYLIIYNIYTYTYMCVQVYTHTFVYIYT